MIQIGVGENDFIDAANAAAPQEWRDLLSGHVRAVHGAGIIKDSPAVGHFENRAASMANS